MAALDYARAARRYPELPDLCVGGSLSETSRGRSRSCVSA